MRDIVKEKIEKAVKKAGYKLPADFSVETPPKPEMGDFATNIALLIKEGEPRQVAEKIVAGLKDRVFAKVIIAGPGFINLFLSPEIYAKEMEAILEEGEKYGSKKNNKKISVEYISANPTGPLHIGNARGGPIGEALANLYGFLGYKVLREFYINDIGGQIDRFAESLYFWYYKKIDDRAEFPEGGYKGDYIKTLSEKIQKECATKLSEMKEKEEMIDLFKKEGLYHTIKDIRENAQLLGIEFDRWVNQSDFEHSGQTEEIIKVLEAKDAIAKKEGAVWFKNPEDPGLEDRESVLKKSDQAGTLTYFADDIAYHMKKYEEGNALMIDVWGANHSGHVARIKSALKVLGFNPNKLNIILYQYVRLKNAGGVVSMSKRFGNIVTLKQVIDSGVQPDAFKYFILSQNPNTPFDFDLKLASDTSEKNPVFYIKYAHARICSILKKVKKGSEIGWSFADLKEPKEVALYKELSKFTQIIENISFDFQIQALPHYAYKIAGLFHDFYASCPVLESEPKTKKARLALIIATKIIIKNSLNICGIEAPEKM